MTDQTPVTDNKAVTDSIAQAFEARRDLIPATVVAEAVAQVAASRK